MNTYEQIGIFLKAGELKARNTNRALFVGTNMVVSLVALFGE
jgi:hypothetical protein